MIHKNDELQKYYERFWFLFLAGTYTLITFSLFLNFHKNYETKSDDFNFYILGWAFFVPLGIIMAQLAEKLHQDFLKRIPSFSLVSVFSNFSFLLYLLCPATWTSQSGWTELGEFLLLQCCIIFVFKSIQLSGRTMSLFLEKSLMVLMVSFLAIWVLSLAPPSFAFFENGSVLNWLFSCLVVLLIYYALFYRTRKVKKSILDQVRTSFFITEFFFYLSVLFLIIILVIDPNFGFDQYHYAFFLGPLADFENGKSFLVNINSQYGIFVFYFLSVFFKVFRLGIKVFVLF
jgi:hypothetical protein